MKRCASCKEQKDPGEFGKDRSRKDSLNVYCRSCARKSIRASRARNAGTTWVEEKQCGGCKKVVPRAGFNKNKSRRDGLANECRTCDNKRSLQWAAENRKVARTRASDWYHNNTERSLEASSKWKLENRHMVYAHSQRRRIRSRGTLTEWDLEYSAGYREAIAQDPCFYCGLDDPTVTYHIDHFFPVAKGGDDRWHNLVRTCKACNLSKATKCGTRFILTQGVCPGRVNRM